jgi:hypothetical protein
MVLVVVDGEETVWGRNVNSAKQTLRKSRFSPILSFALLKRVGRRNMVEIYCLKVAITRVKFLESNYTSIEENPSTVIY